MEARQCDALYTNLFLRPKSQFLVLHCVHKSLINPNFWGLRDKYLLVPNKFHALVVGYR